MTKSFTALATSMLPQYNASAAFMERFLVAAHIDGTPIERSPNSRKIKLVDGSELDADILNYFIQNKKCFRSEFTDELKGRISDEEFRVFCQVVADEWFDGKRLRQDGRPRRLKRSVCDYLSILTGSATPPSQFVQTQDLPLDVEPLITVQTVAAILTVNDQMIYRHVEAWKAIHPVSTPVK